MARNEKNIVVRFENMQNRTFQHFFAYIFLFNITHSFKMAIFGISIKFPSKRDQTMLCLDNFLKNVVIFTRCPTAELPRAVKKIPQTSLGVSMAYFDQYRPINQKMQ